MRIVLNEFPSNWTSNWSMMPCGWGNGYVLLDKDHKYFGKHYDDIPVEVHGSLTFSELVKEEMLKHFKELSKEDIGKWMIGFDTAHFRDTKENWTKEKVKKEAIKLMEQLK